MGGIVGVGTALKIAGLLFHHLTAQKRGTITEGVSCSVGVSSMIFI